MSMKEWVLLWKDGNEKGSLVNKSPCVTLTPWVPRVGRRSTVSCNCEREKKGKSKTSETWILELVLSGFFLHFSLQPTSQCMHSPPSCGATGGPGLAQQVLTHSSPPFVSPGSSQVPELMGSVVLACLSCPAARGTFVPWPGIKLMSPALEGSFSSMDH